MSSERWYPIPGMEDLYQVSDLGRVRSLPRRIFNKGIRQEYTLPGRIMKPRPDKDGYLTVGLTTEDGQRVEKKMHRLVAETVHPNPTGLPEVDHRNRIRDDNRAENLRWATVSLNRTLPEYDGKGVRFREGPRRTKPWQVSVSVAGKHVVVGHYATKEAAESARKEYLHGDCNGHPR